MKQLLFILLFLFCFTKGYTQQNAKKDSIHTFQMMAVPSTLFHFRIPSVQMAFQYRFNRALEISQEVGLITFSHGIYDNRQGIRLRTEPRFYLYDVFYTSLQLRYWQMNIKDTGNAEWFGGLFERPVDYRRQQKAFGVNMGIGAKFNLGGKSYIEFGGALGFQQINNKIFEVPEDAVLDDGVSFSLYDNNIVDRNDHDVSATVLVIQVDVRIGLGFFVKQFR